MIHFKGESYKKKLYTSLYYKCWLWKTLGSVIGLSTDLTMKVLALHFPLEISICVYLSFLYIVPIVVV